jgi:N-methylhydantoinase B/oxoprolinase/acetone carboxylase alpha subunit
MNSKTNIENGQSASLRSGALFGWVVEISPGCWLAPWHGDPGRTLVRTSARVFKTQCGAFRAIAHASKFRDMSRAMLEPQRMKPNAKDEPHDGSKTEKLSS